MSLLACCDKTVVACGQAFVLYGIILQYGIERAIKEKAPGIKKVVAEFGTPSYNEE